MELLLRACLFLLPVLALVDGSETELIVKEDGDAILTCSFGDKDITNKDFVWKKDDSLDVFFYDDDFRRYGSSGRVSHFPDQLKNGNASIIIRKTQPADSGRYTCISPHEEPQRRAVIQLIVGASPEPIVTLNKTDEGILLRCVVRGASPKPEVVWKDSSGNTVAAKEPQVSNSTDKEGSYDIVLEATVTKTDNYRCVSTQKEIYHQIYTATHVPFPKGAAPKPVIELKQTDAGMLLLCEVYGAFPKPEVVFQDSSGNILPAEESHTERGGRYDVILQTTVTKSDDYLCVSTQKELGHQISTKTHVNVPPDDSSGKVTVGVVVGVVVGVGVVGVVLGVSVGVCIERRRKCNSRDGVM